MNRELEKTIHQAIVSRNTKLLRECFYILKSAVSEEKYFLPEDAELFVSLLEQQRFLELGGGWYFIILFHATLRNLPDVPQTDIIPDQIIPALQLAEDAVKDIAPELIYEVIEQAIASEQDSEQEMYIDDCADAISTAISTLNYFPQKYFELIVKLLKQQSFLEAQGSWHLLFVLGRGNGWEILCDAQKNQLLPLLETSYGAFTDWMSWFVISEMLGEYFANEPAFEILCRLKNIEAEGPRSLVPHGLEHIVLDSHNEILAKQAYAELLEMNNDPSEQVRDEVNTSLQRIANRRVSKALST